MYQFLESIKLLDGKLHNLQLHQDRVNSTFNRHYPGTKVLDLSQIEIPQKYQRGLFKFRILYNCTSYKVNFENYKQKLYSKFQCVYSDQIDYSFKFSNREQLNSLKTEHKFEEIIIIKKGLICDTSYSNLIFKKNNQWYTPSSYLLNGTQRQHLLKEKKIKEIKIQTSDIKEFESFKMINSMNSFEEAIEYSTNIIFD